MANKLYNSESKKYNNTPKLDSIGAYVLYENGTKEYFLNIPLTDGLATSASAGSFAITSNATGRGEIFSSSGSQWVSQTSPGGVSIGGAVTGGTSGSIPFISATGLLSQDNPNLFWNDTENQLKLWGNSYINEYIDFCLSVSDGNPAWYGGLYRDITKSRYFIDVEPSINFTSDYLTATGIFSVVYGKTSATGGSLYGAYTGANSYGNTTGGMTLVGIRGFAYVRSQNEEEAYGGWFEAFEGGNSGGTNTTPLYGIYASAAGGHNGTTPLQVAGKFISTNLGGGGLGIITEARGIEIIIDGAPSLTNYGTTKGIALQGWTAASGGTWETSYGIYADTSIDRGATKYFIYSLSNSPSLFTGEMILGSKLTMTEQTAPAAPAANGGVLYLEDNGSGKTRLMVRFATGASQQIAIEP